MARLLIPTDTSQATLGYLLADGSIALTGTWDVGAFDIKHEDNKGVILGTGDDTSLTFDGTKTLFSLGGLLDIFGASVTISSGLTVTSSADIAASAQLGKALTIRDKDSVNGFSELSITATNILNCSGKFRIAGDAIQDSSATDIIVMGGSHQLNLSTDPATYSAGMTFSGRVTATDGLIDGNADEVTFTVQAHSTQTNDVFVVEDSGGENILAVNKPADTASEQILILSGPARGTAVADDEAFLSLFLDSEDENKFEFGRFTWIASDISGARNGTLELMPVISDGIDRTNAFTGNPPLTIAGIDGPAVTVQGTSRTNVVLVAKLRDGSSTGDLFQAQNSSGSALASFGDLGTLGLSGSAASDTIIIDMGNIGNGTITGDLSIIKHNQAWATTTNSLNVKGLDMTLGQFNINDSTGHTIHAMDFVLRLQATASSSTAAVTEYEGVRVRLDNDVDAKITNASYIRFTAPSAAPRSGSGTVQGINIPDISDTTWDKVYGLHIADQTAAGTDTFPIFQEGTTGENILNAPTIVQDRDVLRYAYAVGRR